MTCQPSHTVHHHHHHHHYHSRSRRTSTPQGPDPLFLLGVAFFHVCRDLISDYKSRNKSGMTPEEETEYAMLLDQIRAYAKSHPAEHAEIVKQLDALYPATTRSPKRPVRQFLMRCVAFAY